MPKKHTPGFKTTKPQAAPHASLASRPGPSGETATGSKTVNQRLQELRVSQGTSKSRASVSNSTPASHIDIPQQALQARRSQARIAGPPPPRSWATPRIVNRNRQLQGLASSRYAIRNAQHEEMEADATYQPPPFMPDQPFPPIRSLRATSLRLVARNLNWHIANEHEWLNDVLTVRMKCELLAIIALLPLRSSRRLDKRSMRYLFEAQRDSHGRWRSGGEGITHLNYGSEIQDRKDYITLSRYLKQKSNAGEAEVPEYWDEEEVSEDAAPQQEWSDSASSASASDLDKTNVLSLVAAPKLPFLPSLTHLSLARSCFPCWWALIEMGSTDALCHLTHLDLSYWPEPTIIPLLHHSKSTQPQIEVRTSNSHEHDQREVNLVFNQLGKTCRKLVWLGLEGCESWIFSLLAVYEKTVQVPRSRYDIVATGTRSTLSVDWTGVWRGLATLKCFQSWIPEAFDHAEMPSSILRVDYSTAEHSFWRWWQVEKQLRTDEFRIAEWRLEAKQSPLRFDKTPVQSWIDLEIRSPGDGYDILRRIVTNTVLQNNSTSLLPTATRGRPDFV